MKRKPKRKAKAFDSWLYTLATCRAGEEELYEVFRRMRIAVERAYRLGLRHGRAKEKR